MAVAAFHPTFCLLLFTEPQHMTPNLIDRIQLHKLLSGLDEFTLSVGEAELYLGISESTLFRRRKEGLPPRYVQLQEGTEGSPVKYMLSDLRAFLEESKVPLATERPAATGRVYVDGKFVTGVTRKTRARVQKWENFDVLVTEEEALEPFFIDSANHGLVLGFAWENNGSTFERFVSPTVDVGWFSWEAALSKVWSVEASRLLWLQVVDQISPGLLENVEANRTAMFSRI
jgi:hypothetical protein